MTIAWTHPRLVEWSHLVLDSHARWTGRQLVERDGTAEEQAERLFRAPVVVLSHGAESDPLVNYANQAALDLWEVTWDQLVGTPSRLTAEPMNREERARFLRLVTERGWCDDYRGVRISRTGKRFLVNGAVVWNVVDGCGTRRGQAAAFSRWTRL